MPQNRQRHGERTGQAPRVPGLDKPLGTVVAGAGKHALVSAHLLQKGHVHSNSQMVKGADEPMRTQATRAEHCIVSAHMMVDTTGHSGGGADAPLKTIATGGHHAVITGTIIGAGGPAYQGKPRAVDGPMHTLTTESHAAVASASLVKLRGDNIGQGSDEPLATISAGGTHHGVSVAYLAQHNGGFNTNPGHEATEPASTISAKGSQQQIVSGTLAAYYGNDQEGQCTSEPLRTVTVKERFGFVKAELKEAAETAVIPGMTAEQLEGAYRVAAFLRKYGVEFEGEFATVGGFVIVDIGMRMLTARELFRAQGFGNEYVIDRAWVIDPHTGEIKEIALTKEQQIRMCGNSVSPPVAEALVRANSSDMSVYRLSEQKQRTRELQAA